MNLLIFISLFIIIALLIYNSVILSVGTINCKTKQNYTDTIIRKGLNLGKVMENKNLFSKLTGTFSFSVNGIDNNCKLYQTLIYQFRGSPIRSIIFNLYSSDKDQYINILMTESVPNSVYPPIYGTVYITKIPWTPILGSTGDWLIDKYSYPLLYNNKPIQNTFKYVFFNDASRKQIKYIINNPDKKGNNVSFIFNLTDTITPIKVTNCFLDLVDKGKCSQIGPTAGCGDPSCKKEVIKSCCNGDLSDTECINNTCY